MIRIWRVKFAILVVVLLIISLHRTNISAINSISRNLLLKEEPPDEIFEITSEFTEKSYSIEVHLPYDYDENRSEGYPVLYFPNYLFHNPATGNVWNQYSQLNEWNNFTYLFEHDILPRVLIIGITDLQFSESRYEQDVIRDTDNFYNFLEQELIPYVDNNFNTHPSDRILAGWVETGYFILETFFRYPNTIFNKFISIEGYLYPGSQRTDGVYDLILAEEEMANRLGDGAEVDVDLFMGASLDDYESYTPFKELSRSLFRRNYNNLNFRTEVFNPNEFNGYPWYTGLGIWQNYNKDPYAAYQIENEDVYVGEEVFFTFAGSLGNRTNVAFLWDFDDGTASSERSPSHVYTIAGEYLVNLTITDEFNMSISYVIPGGLKVYPGNRPIEPGETTYNLRNTESYKRRENNVNETKFPTYGLILLPIIVVINIRLRRKNIVNKEK